MTTDELRAAAKRLRGSCQDTIRDHPYGNLCFELDAVAVFDAYLAEYPADDGEPVTEGWLELSGFIGDASTWFYLPLGEHENSAALVITSMSDRFAAHLEKRGVEIELPDLATRGDVRRLRAALGVPLQEPPDVPPPP